MRIPLRLRPRESTNRRHMAEALALEAGISSSRAWEVIDEVVDAAIERNELVEQQGVLSAPTLDRAWDCLIHLPDARSEEEVA